MVKQGLKKGLQWKARIQTEMFEDVFRRRVTDDSVKIAAALERNFLNPQNESEVRIAQYVSQYRGRKRAEYEAELFTQRRRSADAERKLRGKETKKAREDVRISGNKIDWLIARLADLNRTEELGRDSRIFPFWYAPVFTMEDGEFVIKPMRYHCRPCDKPESFDKKFPGLYNARRDNLDDFWKGSFGRKHGFIIATSFYENVALHDFEKRELNPGEKPSNLVLHFNPRPPVEMFLACIWDVWTSPGKPDLYSFAAITDDPPPEVAATGHERCVVPLRESNLRDWLQPDGKSKDELFHLLDDRERPYYTHSLAA